MGSVLRDEKSSPISHTTTDLRCTANKILNIIFDYALNKFDDYVEQFAAGRPKFLSVIDNFVTVGSQIEMCLPAFPFKSANKIDKVFGILPDKAEELALERLNSMCQRIGDLYQPGARLTIISDGLVYNGSSNQPFGFEPYANRVYLADLLGIPDSDTWAYGEALRDMAVQKGFNYIKFSRLKDLVSFSLPEQLDEITYVANATNFRRFLFNNFGNDNIDIDHEIATNPDTQMTYLGYRRFLESDLRHIFPLGKGRSNHRYKNDVKYLAKQMLIRGYVCIFHLFLQAYARTACIIVRLIKPPKQAFAGAVRFAFPKHLRLSIHKSTGEHKVSMSLLNTKTGFTTPWHCSVALMADGEWISATMSDFKKDTRLEIIHENGRPSYFREKVYKLSESDDDKKPTQIQEVSKGLNGYSAGMVSQSESAVEKSVEKVEAKLQRQTSLSVSQSLDESEESSLTKLRGPISYDGIKDENGKLINSFSGTEHPLLDPTSTKFSSKAWLETLMSITSRNPERYPQRSAGIAFKNLSVHGFGEPTDYQKTFGNYFLSLSSFAKMLVAKRQKTRIQILKDLDGLILSGEMLMVLGRPGR